MVISSSLGLGDILALGESTCHSDQEALVVAHHPDTNKAKVTAPIPGFCVTFGGNTDSGCDGTIHRSRHGSQQQPWSGCYNGPKGWPPHQQDSVASWLSDTTMAPGICMVLMMKGTMGISRDPGYCRPKKPDMAPC